MKPFPVLSASVVLGLAACNSFNSPLSSSGFDPLLPPGAGGRLQPGQPALKAGDLVRAIMDNTFFFKQLPKGEADADKTLLRGTGMKVVRVTGSYLQVELDVTGEVGYVPAIMVESASAAPAPGQVPPLPAGAGDMNPLTPLDPATQPPGGAIPVIIDPTVTPAPAAVPPPAPPPTPTGPGTDPVPPLEPKAEATTPTNPVVPKVEVPVPPKPVEPKEKPATEAPTGQ